MGTATGRRSKYSGPISLLLAIALGTSCGHQRAREGEGPAVAGSSRTIEQVLAAHTDSLMAVPGVLGTAIGRCEGAPCIRVLGGKTGVDTRARYPRRLWGLRVR